ncbi:MAG TPA: hypothetical protein PLL32_08105 [Anaeromyxobacteraceae bacterium]|nr:hypothetical protein [Anaeromyxobacteraceae bacterium]
MPRLRVNALPFVVLLLSACATTGTSGSSATGPATGGIVMRDGDRVGRVAAYWPERVAVGWPSGPADAYLDRKSPGTWTGAAGGMEPFELTVSGNRITGPGTEVAFTRIPMGFRLEGLWNKCNVDLQITDSEAVTQMGRSVRQGDGAYPQPDWPRMTRTLVGEAANLADPAWPQLPLTMLLTGWGLQSLGVRAPGEPVTP